MSVTIKNTKYTQDPKKIYMAEWLHYKPYDTPIKGYDEGYVKVCNQIYATVLAVAKDNSDTLHGNKIQLAKLITINLVSYLEDFVNEIGLWRVFTDANLHNFGKPLGIVPLSLAYNTDDINTEDIQYLLWHYMMIEDNKETIFNPEGRLIKQTADFIYTTFDAALENETVTGCDVYDNYFTITAKTNFFDIKTKLNWLTFRSFLCGQEFTMQYDEIRDEIIDETEVKTARENQMLAMDIYNARNPFFYKNPSSMGALTVREILASVAHTTDVMRQQIRDMRHYGKAYCFVHKIIDKNRVDMQIIGTQRRLMFNLNSMPPTTRNSFKTKQVWQINLVKWGQDYWTSGSCISMGGVEQANIILKHLSENVFEMSNSSALLDATDLDKSRQFQQQYSIAFEAYFGAPIVFCKNQAETEPLYQGLMAWQNKHIPLDKNGKPDETRLLDANYWQKCADTPELYKFRAGLLEIDDYYFLMDPKDGIFMNELEGLKQVPRITAKKTPLTGKEGNILLDCVTCGSPFLSRYLFEKYDFTKIGFYPSATPAQKQLFHASLPALQRFFHPEHYDTFLPNQSMIDKVALDTPFV